MAVAGRQSDGAWKKHTPDQLLEESQGLATGLLQIGLTKGDRLGIFTHCGSPEWCIADAATLQIGIQLVPLHATSRPDEILHIFQDAELKGFFVSNFEMLERLAAAFLSAGATSSHPDASPDFIFTFEKIEKTDQRASQKFSEKTKIQHWQEVARDPSEEDLQKIESLRTSLREQDIATILYTSGTTGKPKGVMLSHQNIISNIKSVMAITPVGPSVVCLSFLPMSHIFERMVAYCYLAAGAEIWFSDSIERLPETMREVRPHFFTAVPRIIERMEERLIARRDSLNFLSKKIFDWAIRLGERYPYAGEYSMPVDYRLKLWIAKLLVFNQFRRAMGGRIKYVAVGAAALQPRLGRLLSAAGLDIREGYGLTETSPVISFNRFEPGGVRFGTVGIPLPSLEVRLAPPAADDLDGEIEVRGPSVMLGYLNLPDETAVRFTPDGWFRTGDVGKFEHKRFLKITGRASEVFKTSTGKFVAPLFVEQQILESHFVGQCMVLGLNRSFVGALIVPNFEHLENWCRENKVHWTAPQFMILNPKVEKFFRSELERINEQSLGAVEKVRGFKLLHENWTAENGLLTPTLKLRREKIVATFQREIEEIFSKKVDGGE